MTNAIGSWFNPVTLTSDLFRHILDSAHVLDRLSNFLTLRTATKEIWTNFQNEYMSEWLWDHLVDDRNRIRAYLLCDRCKVFQAEIAHPALDGVWGYYSHARIYYVKDKKDPYRTIRAEQNKIKIVEHTHQGYVDHYWLPITVCKYPVEIENFVTTVDESKLIVALSDEKIKIVDLATKRINLFKGDHDGHVKNFVIYSKRLYTISYQDKNNKNPTKRIICVWNLKSKKRLAKRIVNISDIPRIEVKKVGIIFDLKHGRAIIYKNTKKHKLFH